MHTNSSQSGRISKSVSVLTDARGNDSINLRFTVEIRKPIDVKPAYRFVLNTTEGVESSTRILLHRTDGKNLEVRRTKVPLEGVSVTASAVPDAPVQTPARETAKPMSGGAASRAERNYGAGPGDVWLEMVAGPSLAPGRYSDSVQVATNDPESPEIAIPFTIRVRPLIDTRPSVVRLWTAPTNNAPGRSAIVTLQHSGGRRFEVTSIEVSDSRLFTAVPYGESSSTQHTIRVNLADDLDADKLGASVEGWIRITTNDPEKPSIDVPVLVAPTQTLSRRPVDGIR